MVKTIRNKVILCLCFFIISFLIVRFWQWFLDFKDMENFKNKVLIIGEEEINNRAKIIFDYIYDGKDFQDISIIDNWGILTEIGRPVVCVNNENKQLSYIRIGNYSHRSNYIIRIYDPDLSNLTVKHIKEIPLSNNIFITREIR